MKYGLVRITAHPFKGVSCSSAPADQHSHSMKTLVSFQSKSVQPCDFCCCPQEKPRAQTMSMQGLPLPE